MGTSHTSSEIDSSVLCRLVWQQMGWDNASGRFSNLKQYVPRVPSFTSLRITLLSLRLSN